MPLPHNQGHWPTWANLNERGLQDYSLLGACNDGMADGTGDNSKPNDMNMSTSHGKDENEVGEHKVVRWE